MVLLGVPWISEANKTRMVEWMGRLELAAYVGMSCPELHLDEITNYAPRSSQDDWPQLIKRATAVEDDGHTSKFIRGLIQGERVSKEFEDKDNFLVKGDMWMKIAHMCKSSLCLYFRLKDPQRSMAE